MTKKGSLFHHDKPIFFFRDQLKKNININIINVQIADILMY